ncbi:MAG TPA: trehalose-6-phosphate synthase [Planctomycetota bacterium]|nr:trehalose-6-phosphate synthase [Planctomycetota bacterium]
MSAGRRAAVAVVVLVGILAAGHAIANRHEPAADGGSAGTSAQVLWLATGVVALLCGLLVAWAARAERQAWSEELRAALQGRAASSEAQALVAGFRSYLDTLADGTPGVVPQPWTARRLRRTLHERLAGEGVLIVANREPYLHERMPSGEIRVRHPASGMVSALEPVMRACSGVWVAHGSGSADRETVDSQDRVPVPPGEEAYVLRRIWLSSEEERGYYYGFANEGLWPLCHIVHTRPVFRRDDWEMYQRVNRRFSEAACEEAGRDDPIIFLQDYHFAMAPRHVRELLPRSTILSFWHIPWPNAERLGICPWAAELVAGMLGSSILGFHTQAHCNNFLDAVDRYLEARIDRANNAVMHQGRATLVRPYPISVEWPNRWALQAPSADRCRTSVFEELKLAPDALLGIGVDRMDYTKGIEERFAAIELLLEKSPEWRGRFTFVQLAAPSRTLLGAYRELNEVVVRAAQRVNGRFARGRWSPIVLLRGHHEPPAIFRFYRAADLCCVSSLHDGMNLVAKEFVAAREDERGVLILSQFTGAAGELPQALIVNPYDAEQTAGAMRAALSMLPAEQRARMRAMRQHVSEFNVYRWAGRMIDDAARLREQGRVSESLEAHLRRESPEPRAAT